MYLLDQGRWKLVVELVLLRSDAGEAMSLEDVVGEGEPESDASHLIASADRELTKVEHAGAGRRGRCRS